MVGKTHLLRTNNIYCAHFTLSAISRGNVVFRTSIKPALALYMKFCLSGNSIELTNLYGDTLISDVVSKLSAVLPIPKESVVLIYKGSILDHTKQLQNYGEVPFPFLSPLGIADNSIIHVVVMKKEQEMKALEMPPATCCGEQSTSSRPEPAKKPEMTVMASIFTHIFCDLMRSCNPPPPSSVPLQFECLARALQDDPSILVTAIQTPFYQDILSDIPFMRKLILANPIIQLAINDHPELLNFINDDSSLQELSSILLNPDNFSDFKHLKQMIVQKIEGRIGEHLPPPPNPVSFLFLFSLLIDYRYYVLNE